jgi:hypothetical protein
VGDEYFVVVCVEITLRAEFDNFAQSNVRECEVQAGELSAAVI